MSPPLPQPGLATIDGNEKGHRLSIRGRDPVLGVTDAVAIDGGELHDVGHHVMKALIVTPAHHAMAHHVRAIAAGVTPPMTGLTLTTTIHRGHVKHSIKQTTIL